MLEVTSKTNALDFRREPYHHIPVFRGWLQRRWKLPGFQGVTWEVWGVMGTSNFWGNSDWTFPKKTISIGIISSGKWQISQHCKLLRFRCMRSCAILSRPCSCQEMLDQMILEVPFNMVFYKSMVLWTGRMSVYLGLLYLDKLIEKKKNLKQKTPSHNSIQYRCFHPKRLKVMPWILFICRIVYIMKGFSPPQHWLIGLEGNSGVLT